jgi:hypothetical protein
LGGVVSFSLGGGGGGPPPPPRARARARERVRERNVEVGDEREFVQRNQPLPCAHAKVK